MRPLIKTYPYDYPPLGLQEHPRLAFKKRAAYSLFSSATNASPTL